MFSLTNALPIPNGAAGPMPGAAMPVAPVLGGAMAFVLPEAVDVATTGAPAAIAPLPAAIAPLPAGVAAMPVERQELAGAGAALPEKASVAMPGNVVDDAGAALPVDRRFTPPVVSRDVPVADATEVAAPQTVPVDRKANRGGAQAQPAPDNAPAAPRVAAVETDPAPTETALPVALAEIVPVVAQAVLLMPKDETPPVETPHMPVPVVAAATTAAPPPLRVVARRPAEKPADPRTPAETDERDEDAPAAPAIVPAMGEMKTAPVPDAMRPVVDHVPAAVPAATAKADREAGPAVVTMSPPAATAKAVPPGTARAPVAATLDQPSPVVEKPVLRRGAAPKPDVVRAAVAEPVASPAPVAPGMPAAVSVAMSADVRSVVDAGALRPIAKAGKTVGPLSTPVRSDAPAIASDARTAPATAPAPVSTPWRFVATPAAVAAPAPVRAADTVSVPITTVPAPVATPPVAGRTAVPAATPVAPAPTAPATPAPAAMVFASAIAASDEQDRGMLRDTATPVAVDPATLTAPVAAAAANTDSGAPLDLTQPRWPGAMIARIETLRDAADAADTRIRLIPDALGAIDVALKRDGDTIHVQFTAEQAQTRALLQEAQPRLAEAAERSGLKLGQTSVEAAPASGGNSTQTGSQGSSSNPSLSQSLSQGMAQGHGQGPARQHQPATPARPVSAGSQANTADAADDDGRVA